MQILSGHVSPETAYVVEDYPYGFRLRCQIRYWLEWRPGKGFRLMSQTSNPKREGLVWNKPKGSVYSRFGGVMFLNEDDHVAWHGLNEYGDAAEAIAWRDKFGGYLDAAPLAELDLWIKAKVAYEARFTKAA